MTVMYISRLHIIKIRFHFATQFAESNLTFYRWLVVDMYVVDC